MALFLQADVLKATLATDAVIGSTVSVHTPGSGYVLLHHVMGETDGDRGIWSYVEGGMGSVSKAIGNAAIEAGAHVVTDAEVSQLLIENSSTVCGVTLADGTEVHSSIVLSNATPYKTFIELVPDDVLPDDFVHAIKHSDYSSATTKINVAVDKLPEFRSCKLDHPHAGPQHVGTIHIGSESMEDIHSACQDAANGTPSRRPVIEMTIPSVLDKTISPPGCPTMFSLLEEVLLLCFNTRPGSVDFVDNIYLMKCVFFIGKHVINLFVQYTPYKPLDGDWQDHDYRESFAKKCFTLIDEYAPGFSTSIIGYDMLTPPDLERVIGLTGGNIFHGAMGLDSLFLMRPAKGWSNYKTPLQGLYLCGSGAHPGGGVMGAPGRNAARVVLQDILRQSYHCYHYSSNLGAMGGLQILKMIPTFVREEIYWQPLKRKPEEVEALRVTWKRHNPCLVEVCEGTGQNIQTRVQEEGKEHGEASDGSQSDEPWVKEDITGYEVMTRTKPEAQKLQESIVAEMNLLLGYKEEVKIDRSPNV
ncbi:hypothetical protein V8G54_005215 [Vigna mungo]|uniref:Uncharacterized protein n=1 Tax=Vigna mungo TaxID=3915 RepID=A0AAQ3SGG5_VIGMU